MRPAKLIVGFLLLLSLAGNAILYFKYRNRRPVITVNGETITYKDIVDSLMKKEGPTIKATLTEQILVHQEAEKQKVWPSDAEIAEEFRRKKELDWQFAREVRNNPWMEEEKSNQIRLDFARHRLLTKDVPISEDQLKEEYNEQKAIYDTPTLIRCNMAIMFRDAPVEEIKKQLEKQNPRIEPAEIQRTNVGKLMFIGDNDVFTVQQPYGIKPLNSQVTDLLEMKPGEVRVLPATELEQMGAKNLAVRLLEVIPGKPADLNDPKVREKLRIGAALKRSKPWQEYFLPLWTNAKFDSVDPNDQHFIELIFFPERATSTVPRQ